MVGFLEFMFYMLVFVACITSILSFVLLLGLARLILKTLEPAPVPAPKQLTRPPVSTGRNGAGDPTLRPIGTNLLDLPDDAIPYHLPAPEVQETERKNLLRNTT